MSDSDEIREVLGCFVGEDTLVSSGGGSTTRPTRSEGRHQRDRSNVTDPEPGPPPEQSDGEPRKEQAE